MKLEEKLFNYFFYLFVIGITFSLIIVIAIIFYFSGNYLDERTASEVNYIEKRFAEANINSLNIILLNIITELQVSLQQQESLYQTFAKNLLNVTEDLKLNNTDIYNPYELKELMKLKEPEFIKKLSFVSMWFINTEIRSIEQMNPYMKKQLYAFSLMLQSMIAVINSSSEIKNIFFVFDNTDLYLSYPFTYELSWDFLDIFDDFEDNPSWCTDERGKIITYYKFKCRPFYRDIMNAQKKTFDLNFEDQKERKIFIVPPLIVKIMIYFLLLI